MEKTNVDGRPKPWIGQNINKRRVSWGILKGLIWMHWWTN
jgi:hypothetical protein